jgi:uncharacterized protein (DUF1015 family)
MVDVQPLRGLKYASEAVGDLAYVVSPPHDVISPEELVYYQTLSPYNILQVEWGREFPNDNHLNNRYTRSANLLRKWRVDGILVKDTTCRYYLYQQTFDVGGRAYTRMGLIARVRLEPWHSSAVLAHERTLSQALHDRLNLLRATATNTSPIMCLYDDPQGQIRELLSTFHVSPADIQVRDKAGGKHLLYPITEHKHIQFIHNFFLTKQLYIADGHHRYETALNYREELRTQGCLPVDHPANFVLMTLIDIDDPGLVVLPTHRLLSGLRKKALTAISTKSVSRYFSVQKLPTEENTGTILDKLAASSQHRPSLVMSTAKHLWLLGLNERGRAYMQKSSHSTAWNELEVAVAQTLLLEGLLGIHATDTAHETSLAYTHDANEALQAVKSGKAQVAILLNATAVKQLRNVVQAGDIMPAKSTYFYPKLLKGLVMHSLA